MLYKIQLRAGHRFRHNFRLDVYFFSRAHNFVTITMEVIVVLARRTTLIDCGILGGRGEGRWKPKV